MDKITDEETNAPLLMWTDIALQKDKQKVNSGNEGPTRAAECQ